MRKAVDCGVTQPRYAVGVTRQTGHLCRSEERGIGAKSCYAMRGNTHRHAGVRARARASACVCMCVLRNYVTKKEEKKKEQVRASRRRYVGRYVGVTRYVTALDLPSSQIRAEVTHA